MINKKNIRLEISDSDGEICVAVFDIISNTQIDEEVTNNCDFDNDFVGLDLDEVCESTFIHYGSMNKTDLSIALQNKGFIVKVI